LATNWSGRGFPWLYAAILAGGLIAIVAIGLAWASFVLPRYSGQPFSPWYPFGFWIWPLGLFALFFVAKAFWLGGWGPGYWPRADDAFRILSERYARGEVTKDQFELMARDLERR